jgi:hypothetical protein
VLAVRLGPAVGFGPESLSCWVGSDSLRFLQYVWISSGVSLKRSLCLLQGLGVGGWGSVSFRFMV